MLAPLLFEFLLPSALCVMPFGHVGGEALASVRVSVLAAGGVVSWPVVGDGVSAAGQSHRNWGSSNSGGRARATVESEPGWIVAVPRYGVQAQQRRDDRPALALFTAHAGRRARPPTSPLWEMR